MLRDTAAAAAAADLQVVASTAARDSGSSGAAEAIMDAVLRCPVRREGREMTVGGGGRALGCAVGAGEAEGVSCESPLRAGRRGLGGGWKAREGKGTRGKEQVPSAGGYCVCPV